MFGHINQMNLLLGAEFGENNIDGRDNCRLFMFIVVHVKLRNSLRALNRFTQECRVKTHNVINVRGIDL